MKEDELQKMRKLQDNPVRKMKVGRSVNDIQGVMSKLHLNNGLYRQKDVENNLEDLREEMQPSKIISKDLQHSIVKK